jgi:hypothetical protein
MRAECDEGFLPCAGQEACLKGLTYFSLPSLSLLRVFHPPRSQLFAICVCVYVCVCVYMSLSESSTYLYFDINIDSCRPIFLSIYNQVLQGRLHSNGMDPLSKSTCMRGGPRWVAEVGERGPGRIVHDMRPDMWQGGAHASGKRCPILVVLPSSPCKTMRSRLRAKEIARYDLCTSSIAAARLYLSTPIAR